MKNKTQTLACPQASSTRASGPLRKKHLMSSAALAGLVLALAPAAQASIILIDPTTPTNAGGFEGTIVSDVVPGWTRTADTGFSAIHPAGARNGDNGIVQNASSSGTFVSDAITQTIGVGDSFSFDFWTGNQGTDPTGEFTVDVSLIFNGGATSLFWETITHQNDGSWVNQFSTAPFLATAAYTDVAIQLALINTGVENDQNKLDDLTFTMTAVPEPSTFVLAALGLLGLVGLRRR